MKSIVSPRPDCAFELGWDPERFAGAGGPRPSTQLTALFVGIAFARASLNF